MFQGVQRRVFVQKSVHDKPFQGNATRLKPIFVCSVPKTTFKVHQTGMIGKNCVEKLHISVERDDNFQFF